MNTHFLHRISPRTWRTALLPLLLALACSACVGYPAYDTGYGYGYADYGYASSYGWGWQPAFSGSYLYRSTYVSPPRVIVHDHRGGRRAHRTRRWNGNRASHGSHHATGNRRGDNHHRWHRGSHAGAARHPHTSTRWSAHRNSSGHHRR